MMLVVTGIGSLIHIYSTAYMHEERGLGVRALLLLPEPVRGVHAGPRARRELPRDVRRVGRRGPLLVPADRLLLREEVGVRRRQEGVHRQPHRRLRVRAGRADALREVRHASTSRRSRTRPSTLSPEATFGTISLATLLLFVGATGKSAQIPLYVWLPDAMEGPTPVSALIHAATMVTAGVYMIGRNAVLFSLAPDTLLIVASIGAATAFFAGTIGLVQNDIKRVLAYSTVSQLGYMFLAMGVGAYARRHFPPLHACVLQGAALPRFRRGHPRARGRAGHPEHGRPEGQAADHLLDVPHRVAGDRRRAAASPASSARTRSCSGRSRAGTRCSGSSGMLTSLMTATYMFRLVFLTFRGERRHARRAGRMPRKRSRPRTAQHGRTAAARRAWARRATDTAITCTTRRRRWPSR